MTSETPEVPESTDLPDGEPDAPEAPQEVLPDMTDVMVDEMRSGVRRYRELAVIEDSEAEKHEIAGPRARVEAREYRAKAASLEAMLNRLGYDLDDRTVSPEEPNGIHP